MFAVCCVAMLSETGSPLRSAIATLAAVMTGGAMASGGQAPQSKLVSLSSKLPMISKLMQTVAQPTYQDDRRGASLFFCPSCRAESEGLIHPDFSASARQDAC